MRSRPLGRRLHVRTAHGPDLVARRERIAHRLRSVMSGKGRQFLDDDLRLSAADGVLDGGRIQRISHHRFGSQGAQGLRSAIRTRHADDRVAGSHQLRHERSADNSARAGDKHSHLYLLARLPQPDPSRASSRRGR